MAKTFISAPPPTLNIIVNTQYMKLELQCSFFFVLLTENKLTENGQNSISKIPKVIK